MKRSTNRKLEEIVRRIIKEETNELDLDKAFWVVRKGGSIGGSNKYYIPGKGNVIATFDSKEEAQSVAKSYRSSLSKGERSYYGMGYIVVPGSTRMKNYLLSNMDK